MSNGKGDKRRPCSISQEEWNDRWELIFGARKNKKDCLKELFRLTEEMGLYERELSGSKEK